MKQDGLKQAGWLVAGVVLAMPAAAQNYDPLPVVIAPPTPPSLLPARPPDGSRVARPIGNPAQWLRTSDYPGLAGLLGLEGRVHFRLDVSASGIPTGCAILVSSGAQALDDKTCIILRDRARFTPATNAQGEAVAGRFSSRIMWVLPKDVPGQVQAFDPDLEEAATPMADPAGWITDADRSAARGTGRLSMSNVHVQLDVSAAGDVTGCAAIQHKKLNQTQRSKTVPALCALLRQRAKFAPARSKRMERRAGIYFASFAWPVETPR